jgi:flagellar hook-associated protein 1 FlgK
MPDLLSILSGAASSLGAQRGLAATASHNIDNASNPNYARQRAELHALVPAEQVRGTYLGRGATLGGVTQARDRFLEAQLPRALGDSGRSRAEAEALEAFHALDPQAAGGLGQALSGFYAGLRALAQNPGDTGLRTAFLGSARVLAQTFNRTAQAVEAARSGLDARVAASALDVNAEAAAVAELNVEIERASASGQPNDLLDLRQAHLDRLAELTGATPVATSGGAVNVVLADGTALVSGGRAAVLSAVPDPANGGHVRLLLARPDGSPASALPPGALSGALGGALDARDGALATAGARVDALAFDVASALNTAHAAGYGRDGVTGRPLFATSATPAGAARALAVAITDPAQVAAAAAPGASGDAAAAQAMLATERAPLSGGADVQATLADVISDFGGRTRTSRAFADQDGAVKDHLTALRESHSGVSIDEELIEMQKAQRGYEAITKVIQVADEMMQTLMQLK